MKKRTRKAAPPRPRRRDDKVIRDCVSIAVDLAGAKAAYSIDPSGNLDYAEPVHLRAMTAIEAKTKELIRDRPQTIAGLLATARLVPRMIAADDDCAKPINLNFYAEFADNVALMLDATPRTSLRNDSIFKRIDAHAAIVKQLASPNAQATDGTIIAAIEAFDRGAWGLLDNPPLTVGGCAALLAHATYVSRVLKMGWPDGSGTANWSRKGKVWHVEMAKVLSEVLSGN